MWAGTLHTEMNRGPAWLAYTTDSAIAEKLDSNTRVSSVIVTVPKNSVAVLFQCGFRMMAVTMIFSHLSILKFTKTGKWYSYE